jgi:hypothetical protein
VASSPYHDVEAMADQSVTLLVSAELRRRLGAAAAAKTRLRHDHPLPRLRS